MITHVFPRFTRPIGSKKVAYSAIAALAAICCLGAVLAQADFYVPPVQGSSTDMSAWINQEIQTGQTSMQTAVISQGGTSVSSTGQAGGFAWSQSGACQSCGNPCPSQQQINPDNPTPAPAANPCEPAWCNPFEDLCGKQVKVFLEGNVSVTGIMVLNCRGFLVLRAIPINKTLTVNIQKILYIESD